MVEKEVQACKTEGGKVENKQYFNGFKRSKFEISVPNEAVCVIIGKGENIIKKTQTANDRMIEVQSFNKQKKDLSL